MTAKKTKQGGGSLNPLVSTLSALAQALRDNPWYFSIVLVGYLNGVGLNLYLLNKQVNFLAVLDNLSVGCAWLGLVATIVFVRTSQLFPLSRAEAKKVIIACLLISSGSLMTLVILKGISNGVQGFAGEFRDNYGYDLRLALKASLGILWLVQIVYFFVVATRGARDAIKSERRSR